MLSTVFFQLFVGHFGGVDDSLPERFLADESVGKVYAVQAVAQFCVADSATAFHTIGDASMLGTLAGFNFQIAAEAKSMYFLNFLYALLVRPTHR